ncbi:hypothetical protein D3C87_1492610 [compost metagenome]
MENNNELKPVTRAHLFARIDATLLSQQGQQPAETDRPAEQDKELPASGEAK